MGLQGVGDFGLSIADCGTSVTEAELKARTKRFALDIIRLIDDLPRERVTEHIARQAMRSATSVAANYRAACRARSDAERAAKLGIVEEEADETQFWLELLVEAGRIESERVRLLIQEADELPRIVAASIKTIRSRLPNSRIRESLAEYDTLWDEDFPLASPQSTIHNPQ